MWLALTKKDSSNRVCTLVILLQWPGSGSWTLANVFLRGHHSTEERAAPVSWANLFAYVLKTNLALNLPASFNRENIPPSENLTGRSKARARLSLD